MSPQELMAWDHPFLSGVLRAERQALFFSLQSFDKVSPVCVLVAAFPSFPAQHCCGERVVTVSLAIVIYYKGALKEKHGSSGTNFV